MEKIASSFIKNQYRSGVDSYSDFTKEVGLWESEKYVFNKYLKLSDRILDLGCGTGRTTFPLFQLGYKKMIGIDLTPEMINEAKELGNYFDAKIDFRVGDARNLDFKDSNFDSVIFSFNGLMSIPNQLNRDSAIKEIGRVIKDSGIFIFTTHDREKEEQFLEFWQEEEDRWKLGKQNLKLHDYGDVITKSKNESREIFIHIPNQDEIISWLNKNGFEIMETFYRNEKFEENEKIKSKSGECRFWVAKRTKNKEQDSKQNT